LQKNKTIISIFLFFLNIIVKFIIQYFIKIEQNQKYLLFIKIKYNYNKYFEVLI